MPSSDPPSISESSQRAVDALKDAGDRTSKAIDESLANASNAVKNGSAQAAEAYGSAYARTEVRA